MVVRIFADPPIYMAATCGPLLDTLTKCLGEPVTSGAFSQITTETILAKNPDVLIVEDWGTTPEDIAALAASEPIWSSLPAVESG